MKRRPYLTIIAIPALIVLSLLTSFAWLLAIGMFAPMFLADVRSHNNLLAISVFNFILFVVTIVSMFYGLNFVAIDQIAMSEGRLPPRHEWYQGPMAIIPAFVGWLVALIWSCTSNVRR